MAQPLTITGTAQTAEDIARQEALKARGPLPRHVAVIMDGNGRWARERGQSRVVGHHEGVKAVRDVTESCAQLGVEVLTLYTFSQENWQRPATEVGALMKLLIHTIRRERKTLEDNNIRLCALGDLDKLPAKAHRELQEAINATAGNTRMTLVLAVSYSGRWELAEAARSLARDVQAGRLDPDALDEDALAAALPSADWPDPDLLIRTGGEFRISNFLLWQLAYTEIVISDVFWPAYRREHLYDAITEFQNRDRRFGRVKA